MEGVRQKLHIGGGFVPTKNDRTSKMYHELKQHAKLIKGLQKKVKVLQGATDGMLGLVETAYTTDLPHDYQIEGKTNTGATSVAVEGPTAITEEEKAQKRAEMAQLRAELGERLQTEVYTPATEWLNEVTQAKGDLKTLEKTRLKLDSSRRSAAKTEMKKVKQQLNKGANSDSFVQRTVDAGNVLEDMKGAYDTEEETVYQKLRELVAKSNVVFDCMEKAFAAGNDIMNKAQAAAPKHSAMAHAAPGTYTAIAKEPEKTPFSSPDKTGAAVAPSAPPAAQAVEAN